MFARETILIIKTQSFKRVEEGERLKIARQAAGLSQYSVAQRINVNREVISRWENGHVWPTAEHLRDVSSLYGVSVDWLLRGDRRIAETPASYNAKGRAAVGKELKQIVMAAQDELPVGELRRIRNLLRFMVQQARREGHVEKRGQDGAGEND